MEIYQLRAFVTVAKTGHLTRAAEILHLTQPAVTAQIKAVEEALGIALFDRKPGKITLTRAGEMVLPKVEEVLAVVQSVMHTAQQLRGQVTGTLVLGTLADPDLLRLGSFLSGLIAMLPMLELKTRTAQAEELVEDVHNGSLSAAFHIGPQAAALPPSLLSMPLQTIPYRIVAPFEMAPRLAGAGWKDIGALPWIGAPPRSHLHALVKELFARQGITPNFVIESDEMASTQSLVRSGVGVTLLREDIATQAAERQEVSIWPHARPLARLAFVYPKSAESDPAIIGALSTLKDLWGL